MEKQDSGRQGRARARRPTVQTGAVNPTYMQLTHPFAPQAAFSDDQIAAMHEGALRILEELGMRVLLTEARDILRRGGALVDEDSQMVRIGRDMVACQSARKPDPLSASKIDPPCGVEIRA